MMQKLAMIPDKIEVGDTVKLRKYNLLKPRFRGSIGKILKIEEQNRFVCYFDKPRTYGSGTIIFRSDILKVVADDKN